MADQRHSWRDHPCPGTGKKPKEIQSARGRSYPGRGTCPSCGKRYATFGMNGMSPHKAEGTRTKSGTHYRRVLQEILVIMDQEDPAWMTLRDVRKAVKRALG